MGRKVKRGRLPRVLQTTDDLRVKCLWTEHQLDRFLDQAGIELLPWQRDTLLAFGRRRTVGVHLGERHPDHVGRSAGRNTVHRITKELALALGHEVKELPRGFEVTMAVRDEVRL